jgi:DNA-nicking Smr family endonuclease
MVRRRELREDERELWAHVTRDVRQPRKRRTAPAAKSKVTAAAVKDEAARPKKVKVQAVQPAVLEPAKRAAPPFGLDGATGERLRRGKIAPEATLDLHGMTQAVAHARLSQFVRLGHEMGNRCLLVVTGKGSPVTRDDDSSGGFVMPERSKAGVLRAMVPRWLEEMRSIVTGVQSGHQRHGGAGAFYVYLRRRR